MALCYELTGEDIEKRIEEQPSLYNALIWASIGVDLGRITESNIDEWVFRVNKLELTNKPVERWMIEHFVGLKTNVANLTRKQWANKHNPLLY